VVTIRFKLYIAGIIIWFTGYDPVAEFSKQTTHVYFVLLKTQQSAAGNDTVQDCNVEAKPFVGVCTHGRS